MNNKYIIIAIAILLFLSVAVTQKEVRKYSINEMRLLEKMGNNMNDYEAFIVLPDGTEILNKPENTIVVRLISGIFLEEREGKGLGITLRDGGYLKTENEWVFTAFNESSFLNAIGFDSAQVEIIQEGNITSMFLPDKTRIISNENNTIVIILPSGIKIGRNRFPDSEISWQIRFSDGILAKTIGGGWNIVESSQNQSKVINNISNKKIPSLFFLSL